MLNWLKSGNGDGAVSQWGHGGTNLCLDFHGDPAHADLVIFSDGNHHMALAETLKSFKRQYPGISGIFYATTPPGPILTLLREGRIKLGNLVLTIKPDLFIAPPHVLEILAAEGRLLKQVPFVKNRGNVLLVKKGNPKNIRDVTDLVRPDITIFISNPKTESVSYLGYKKTLNTLAHNSGLGPDFLEKKAADSAIVYGKIIHHREAPQAVADSNADAAVIYYHLALYCTRMFPSIFEFVSLGGTWDHPKPLDGNTISLTHAGLVNGAGKPGKLCFNYLQASDTARIYASHGLDHLLWPAG